MTSSSEAVKRIVIVGNGPVEPGLADAIDRADLVIRFNEANIQPDLTGTKTDILFLMNSGKSMQARLETPAYWQEPFVLDAKEIILPYHPSIVKHYHPRPNFLSRIKGRKADWTAETLKKIEALGKKATIISADFYYETCRILDISQSELNSVFPSSGLLAIRYTIETFRLDSTRVEFCGFSWQGWKRHSWGNEQRWVDEQVNLGKLSPLLPRAG
ncbi:glycosyltransferase family 29 protein [Phyllobacterium sp. YR531]|uniref:glycosyltransferase family 29 protein n=1 Tax=Phyllobacterium sp. YR531 TaxID=1144343 RepID=UPI00026FAA57|nr:glycosyltransferase family 29 protein [Phyllobacterium sp. YR531]EJM99342.1 Glycosyltransferase family 29 (sialyltransferase) [Phyllobacterium sp. YR531]